MVVLINPKVHDVAPLFVKFIKEKNLEVDEKILEKIQSISQKLAKEKAPAFYGEKKFSVRMRQSFTVKNAKRSLILVKI